MATISCLVSNVSSKSLLCSTEEETHTGLEQHEGVQIKTKYQLLDELSL